jgi:hypothetical protein
LEANWDFAFGAPTAAWPSSLSSLPPLPQVIAGQLRPDEFSPPTILHKV